MRKAMLIVLVTSVIVCGVIGAVVSDEFLGWVAGAGIGICFAIPVILIIFTVETAKSKGYSRILAFLLCFFAGIPVLGALIIVLILPDHKI